MLSPTELEKSLNILIKHAQIECFHKEYDSLNNKKEINKTSKILSLNSFMRNNLVRVGGRLVNSNYNYDKKTLSNFV